MMKKFWILIVFLTVAGQQIAAQNYQQKERIKSLKRAHITEELDLTSQEAEKFWPIYNQYEKEIYEYKFYRTRQELRRISLMEADGTLDTKEAEQSLNKLIDYENKVTRSKEKMFLELQDVISPTKVLKLYKAELDFNKRLLSEYRKRKAK